MLYSKLFPKTDKNGKKYESPNATLLINGGFVNQVMSGVYTFLPLGIKVLTNIEKIVREEMNKIGQEILMPALAPKKLWEDTQRLNQFDVLFKASGANPLSLERNDTEYILNPTHEEVITPLAKHFIKSYKDLPFALYQIQTKFRNETRSKSGILRGREFRMKDLYSFHISESDLLDYYHNKAIPAYKKVFERLGIGEETVITLASGGDFTEKNSHEFQTICDSGEDEIYLNKETGEYLNKEIVTDFTPERYEVFKASEVGNIFPLNIKFSKQLNFTVKDEDGKDALVYMGCYGIGTSRIMGVLVEKFHDERGIIWPKEVAPFDIHLIALDNHEDEIKNKAFEIYKKLTAHGVDVLFDDRVDVRAGEKFADADLIGIPVRIVISKRTGNKVEYKKRDEKESILLSLDEIVGILK